MSDERDRSGYPNPPYAGDTERGEAGGRDGNPRDQNGRDPHHRQGFEPDGGGMHRGPRRSRYGRRRMPGDGPGPGPGPGAGGEYQGEQRDHRPQRAAEPVGEDVDSYLPSFIAGPNGGQDPFAAPARDDSAGFERRPPQQHQPYQGHQGHQSHQAHQGQPHQSHGGHQGGGGYQPSHQGGHPQAMPSPEPHQHHQPPQHHQPQHQAHQVMQQPEEPSPEAQAAFAEFGQWEDSNPKLRGLLVCNPTVKRGEPIVRGTRIPARILAAIAKMGTSVEEMLRDYPALTAEGIDAALAFADANPRTAR